MNGYDQGKADINSRFFGRLGYWLELQGKQKPEIILAEIKAAADSRDSALKRLCLDFGIEEEAA